MTPKSDLFEQGLLKTINSFRILGQTSQLNIYHYLDR